MASAQQIYFGCPFIESQIDFNYINKVVIAKLRGLVAAQMSIIVGFMFVISWTVHQIRMLSA